MKTLFEMSLAELHDEGRRIQSPALLALVKPIADMHDAEIDWLEAELIEDGERHMAAAEELSAEADRRKGGAVIPIGSRRPATRD